MNFLQQIGQALKKPVFTGHGGRGGSLGFAGFRAGYDFRAEAGQLWESSIPLACLKWEQRASVEAEICTQIRDESGDWTIDATHPALDVVANPNPFFDTHQLLDAVKFDYHISGNAYLLKSRSGSGRVVQLWWIPQWMIQPRWEENGFSFIDCYEYSVNGHSYAIPVEDIIHFRNGIDPRSHGRKGLSDFAAVLREICTDNEAAVIAAALCRNMGIPGVIISPKSAGASDDVQLTKSQRDNFKQMWRESFTGDKRGEPFIQSIPVDIQMPGYNLQQMCFDKLRSVPEQRISAAFGLPAVVLGLGTGLENSNSKAGQTDAREQAYESCVIPTLYSLARTLTRSLMSEYDDIKNARIWFDLSEVRCLQGDEDALYKRLSLAWEKGWLKRSEVRERAGFKTSAEDEIYNQAASSTRSDLGGDSEDDPLGGTPQEKQEADDEAQGIE